METTTTTGLASFVANLNKTMQIPTNLEPCGSGVFERQGAPLLGSLKLTTYYWGVNKQIDIGEFGIILRGGYPNDQNQNNDFLQLESRNKE